MHCTKVQKINENKLFISSFLGEKSVFVAKLSKWQQKNNRQMVYYTPLDASISVFGNVIVWGSTGESTVNQLTVTLNRLKKLMVKRVNFSLTMCNLRSKQGTLQKFIRKKFCSFQKYTYLYGDSSHHASHLHSEPGCDFCILQSHQAHLYKWHLVGLLLCSFSILINTVAG